MLKTDVQIRILAQSGMLTPFLDYDNVQTPIPSGLSTCGYDLTLQPRLMMMNTEWMDMDTAVIDVPFDPRVTSVDEWQEIVPDRNGFLILPAMTFALATSVEYIAMPDRIAGICLGKSTYARSGLITFMTIVEPGWEGNLTLEVFNCTSRAMILRPNQGIAQLLFMATDGQPERTYRDKKGKYNGQTGITLSK